MGEHHIMRPPALSRLPRGPKRAMNRERRARGDFRTSQRETSAAASFPSPPLQLLLLLQLAATAAVVSGGAAGCYRSLSRTDFPHCQQLGPGFALHWRVDGRLPQQQAAAVTPTENATGSSTNRSAAAAGPASLWLAAPSGTITFGLDADTGGES